ncbi:MAG TPA: MFS transporter [Acidimicrobiia bacterium]|nr:MFS transporter [Acidimicrobiia bacterium]
MNDAARQVQRTYLLLTLLSTLATSFIWGINTLFLLDAGLSNAEAFTANAFFTVGQVLFEIPTGVVADSRGRRLSYLLGSATLLASTILYLVMWQISAPLWGWALASILLGLGFTFFSGAMEAWLVDALNHTGYTGDLESVFARGQVVGGAAMLTGSVAGGVVAQFTNLGVPYLLRAAMLVLAFGAASIYMRDLGFAPVKGVSTNDQIRHIVRASVDNGLKNRPVRWIMLAAPFTSGVAYYAFYAMQPYLLELWGDNTAFGIAGLAAAIVAGAQILGGLLVTRIRRHFVHRTHALLLATSGSVAALIGVGLTNSFWVAITFIVLWALLYSMAFPMRQAYINALIPSEQRATVLSFDALIGSAGGVVTQPVLGRVADVNGYGASYLVSAVVEALAIPFIALAHRERAQADVISHYDDSIPA